MEGVSFGPSVESVSIKLHSYTAMLRFTDLLCWPFETEQFKQFTSVWKTEMIDLRSYVCVILLKAWSKRKKSVLFTEFWGTIHSPAHVTFTGFSNGIEKDKAILILNKTASTMATAFSWIHLKWIIVVSTPIWNETYFKIKCVTLLPSQLNMQRQ